MLRAVRYYKEGVAAREELPAGVTVSQIWPRPKVVLFWCGPGNVGGHPAISSIST